MATHPTFGDLRAAVDEEGKVLFLVHDVVDMFGISPERTCMRVIRSVGKLHWFDFQLEEGGVVSAPMCDEQIFKDLTSDVGEKYDRTMLWVKKILLPGFKDPFLRKKFLLDEKPVEECKNKNFDIHFYDNVMMVNNQVYLTTNMSQRI